MLETRAGATVDVDADLDHTPTRAKHIRIDAGSARGSDIAAGRGSLLRAFGGWGRRAGRGRMAPVHAAPVAPDRRADDRHRKVECQAWVGWKTFRRFHMNDALVINLSRGGAQVFLDTPPPDRKPVWVFLETPGQNAIVKARVLEFSTTPQGQCVIRVEFDEPCPYACFEAAVCGLAASDPRARVSRPEPVRGPSRRVAAG